MSIVATQQIDINIHVRLRVVLYIISAVCACKFIITNHL